jgi:mRNA interferase HigB
MLILRLAAIEAFLKRHAAARGPMARWVEIAAVSEWHDITDVRRVLPTADAVKGTPFTCFNIGGNNYRLLVIISYSRQQILVHELLTHAEYDKKY